MQPPTIEQIEALSAEHQAIKEFHERNRFYAERLYPSLRDYFAAQPPADPPVDLLVLPVSNPHVPVLVAARWKPRRVYAIYSSQSARHRAAVEAAIAALGLGVACGGETVQNIEVEPQRLYQAIKDALRPFLRPGPANPQVAVDITGGTSVMSVGAAMAVSLVGGRLFYILSAAADDDIQQRKVGSEQPRQLDDPYAVFGEFEAAQAAQLFANHDYADAARGFAALAGRLTASAAGGHGALAALAAAYDLRARLAAALAQWDAFNLAAAEAGLRTLRDHPALGDGPRRQVGRHLALLGQVRPLVEAARPPHGSRDYARAMGRFAEGQIGRLADPARAAALLAALYGNGLRRAAQDRRDTAALMLYRCLELMSQQRLATYGVFTEWARDPMARLAARFPRLRALRAEWKKISLAEGYQILQAIEDPFGARCDLQRIRDGADTRNQSLLAHGFSFISPGDYDSFKAVVDEALGHWCACAGVGWAEALAAATFLTLDQLEGAP
jgi:CRISPR-associated protein (TIGR02710 family)